jgi:hypothetical protein
MAYTNPNFQNNNTPAINATNLNNLANAVQNLCVENGGTGKNSITSGALVKGNGTNAVGEVIGTGALYSATSGSPQFGTLPVNCGGTGVVTLDALKTALGLANAGFVVSDTAPQVTTVLWIDPTNSTMKYYNGTSWVAIRGVYA